MNPNLKAALDEIVSSEVSYVKFLDQLRIMYCDPLRSLPSVLSKTEHELIFGVPSFDLTILPLHRHILSDLRPSFSNSPVISVSLVSSIFCKIAPYLTLYKDFVGSLMKGLILIQRLIHERPSFNEFINSRSAAGRCEPLESLLLMPVQRIPRYVLLLKEVLKHDDSNEEVRASLEDAIALIEDAAKKIDQGVDDIQRRVKLIDIQIQLQPSPTLSLITPTRRMVLDGKLKMQVKKKWVVHYVGLVAPDLLVYGVEDGTNYRNFVIVSIANVKSDKDDETVFHISTSSSSTPITSSTLTATTSLSFKAESKDLAGGWIEALLEGRAELTDLCLRISIANANEAALALKSAVSLSARPSSKSLPARLMVRSSPSPQAAPAIEESSIDDKGRIQVEERRKNRSEVVSSPPLFPTTTPPPITTSPLASSPRQVSSASPQSRSLSASEADLNMWASSLAARNAAVAKEASREKEVSREKEASHLLMKTSPDDAIRSLRASVDLDLDAKRRLQSEHHRSLLQSVTEDADAALTFLRSR